MKLGRTPPSPGKEPGTPNQPAPIAKTASTTSGTVMTGLDSCACSAEGVRGLPRKVRVTWRML